MTIAHDAHPPTEEHDDTVEAHCSGLERLEAPHACIGGLVFVGHIVEGEDGEETEAIEAVPCKRCERKQKARKGAGMTTTPNWHKDTTEEEALDELIDETRGVLSEAAYSILAEAGRAAHQHHLFHHGGLQLEDEVETMARMRRAAAQITESDHEMLERILRGVEVAADSIDAADDKTLVGHKVTVRDLDAYYRLILAMVSTVLDERRLGELEKGQVELEKEVAEFQRRALRVTAECGHEDLENIPF